MRSILVIDTETTGTDPKQHAVIEIAAQFHAQDGTISSFTKKFFNPKRKVDLEALKYNNVAYGSLVSLGSEEIAVRQFIDWLLSLPINSNTRLVGHNVNFDVNFLKALTEDYDIQGFNKLIPYKVHDTSDRGELLIDAGIIKTDSNRSSLKYLAKALGIEVQETALHGAVYDVQLTVQVYKAINELLKEENG